MEQVLKLLAELERIAVNGKRTERELLLIISELRRIEKEALLDLDMKLYLRECPNMFDHVGVGL